MSGRSKRKKLITRKMGMTPRLGRKRQKESFSMMSRNRPLGGRVAKPGSLMLKNISKLLAMRVRALSPEALIRSMSVLHKKIYSHRTQHL